MENKKAKSRLFFSFFILLILQFCLYKSFSFAATEKSTEVSAKTVDTPAASQTVLTASEPLEKETERLMSSLIERGPVVAPPAGATAPEIAQMRLADDYSEFARLKKIKGHVTPDPGLQRLYHDSHLKDGEMLYRVAVSDKTLTLKEATDIGMANSLQVKAAQKKIEVARAKVSEARRALFPTAQGVFTYNGGKAASSETIPGGRYYKGESLKLNVTQPIFYGGELVMTAKQAEANWKSAQAEYEKAKDDYIQQLTTAFYGVVKAEYNEEYQENLYKDADAIYQRLRQEHLKKLIPELDFLNAESQYRQIFYQHETAKNDLLSARLVLFQTMSIDVEPDLPVDLKLDFKKLDLDLYGTLELALTHNPEIRMKEYALESSEWGVKIFKAKKMPRVDLRGSFGTLGEAFLDDEAIATGNATVDTEKEWFLGVTTSMPLGPNSVEYEQVKHHYGPTVLALNGSEDWQHKATFNLFDKLSDITDEKSAEATYLQAMYELDKAKNDTIVSVKDQFYNMQKSLIQIDSSLAKMRYEEKQVAAYRYLVSIQETTAAQLLEGLVEESQDKFSFIQAVADYHLAVAALNVSIGDPDHFQSKS